MTETLNEKRMFVEYGYRRNDGEDKGKRMEEIDGLLRSMESIVKQRRLHITEKNGKNVFHEDLPRGRNTNDCDTLKNIISFSICFTLFA